MPGAIERRIRCLDAREGETVVVEPDTQLRSAVVRMSAEGDVLEIEGDWQALGRELGFGGSVLAAPSASLCDGLRQALQMTRACRFRAWVGDREWLCRVRPDGADFVLMAAELPGVQPAPSHPEHHIAPFVDGAPFHVSVADARERGRVLMWSRDAGGMFGYDDREAIRDLTARDLFHQESDFLAMLAAVEEGHFDRECTMRRKDRSTFDARVLVTGRRDAAGSIIERFTLVEDLSQAKRAEQERHEALRSAGHDDRVRLMGQLAGGIAHDFNNLLTAIMSSAELLELECRDRPAATEDLKVITSAARSASSLTRRLLTFTRNKVEAPRRIDVPSWFEELLPFMQRLVPERVRFEHAMEGTGSIEIDPNELEQVVLNLVVNAVGAMPDGGQLALRCRCIDGRMLLEVEDTGVGMPADLQERVFEPFFTTRAEGTGLGLATARTIVRRAGGEIWVLSAANSGSCFSVSVPLCADGAAAKPAAEPKPLRVEDRGTALLVEDQPDVRYAVERLLRSLGYDVRAEPDVRGGKAALEEMEHCALLLTDYMLPDGTGLDLIEDARAIFPDAHAVLMSGYLQELEAADESFDRLIAKPFTRTQLTELLEELLGDAAATGAAPPR